MKRKLTIAMLAILLVSLVYQGTMAVMQEVTNVDAKMNAATLGITIVQNDDISKEASEHITFENALPGSVLKQNLKVHNSQDKDVYIRVTMSKYWTDANNEKLVNADAKLIELLAEWNDWIVIDDGANSNNEMMYFYYKKPLLPSQTTPAFIDSIRCSSDLKNDEYADYQMKVDIEVDAIQTVGAQDAILSEWGMNVDFDENGSILAIEE